MGLQHAEVCHRRGFSGAVQQSELRLGVQVVSAAGAVDHAQLVQLAEKAFSGLPSSGLSSEDYIKQVCALTTTHPSVLHVRGMHQCAESIAKGWCCAEQGVGKAHSQG